MSKTDTTAASAAGAKYRVVPRWRIHMPNNPGAVDPLMNGFHERLGLSFEDGSVVTTIRSKALQARNMGYEVASLKPMRVVDDADAGGTLTEEEEFPFDPGDGEEPPAPAESKKPRRPRHANA